MNDRWAIRLGLAVLGGIAIVALIRGQGETARLVAVGVIGLMPAAFKIKPSATVGTDDALDPQNVIGKRIFGDLFNHPTDPPETGDATGSSTASG